MYSTIVRDSFNTRWKARVLMPNWFIALRIKALLVSSNSQYSRMCAGPTRAPHVTIFDGAQSPRLSPGAPPALCAGQGVGECRCAGIAGVAAKNVKVKPISP